ncbi:ABC transporter permease [Aureimonas phyllosphaerae]|uniref:Autoinducer 2 import system permease protein LsrD n=1 Tax=Aureimonas phyllosphaerae TaxID=1166078 RepID=A0A7W6FTN6_9HYPH|nr:ABC transporter permease [Aureimonas phyllosphaerae]MBB3934935.1 rhamnose transport system permease protein [Aureimonas phyllosphaerae]MBB3958943.1 rhamnose transport system permease protein [Aureimonas phyllosphaerae]SFF40509.1 monosaccharide ABC transporter membrane protein, CUT2 family [Aureimonas phyllosphaerae]
MTFRSLLRHEAILALILALALAVLAVDNERFFTAANLLNQGRLLTEVGLIAVVMTFVIVTGGIDLSVGSILGLCAILIGVFWKTLGLPLPVAIGLSMVVGTAAGFVNGLIITRFRVPPLIATLATLALYRGLAEGISQAQSIRGYPKWFFELGQGDVFGIPTQLWLLAIVAFAGFFILRYTAFGRATYAIGNNEAGAAFSGIDVAKTKLWIYSASGFVSALAAVVFVSRVSTTRSDMGSGIELDVITAVVLGGTSIFGGRGLVVGTLLGLCLVQVLKNGLALSGVRGDGTIVIIGAVLIAAVLISNFLSRYSGD